LELAGITKHWPGAERPVLDAVDLVVEPGTAVEVAAANGTGKTTLLRVAVGLIRPEHGRVRLGRLDAERDRVDFHRRIGFLSAASAGLYARLTVGDHLRLWTRLALMPGDRRARASARAIDALGLQPLLDRRVDRLSMGQRQRIRLAGAFVHDPDIVLLDEPLNSLDDEGIELLRGEMERVRANGGAALWCAPSRHDPPLEPDRRLTIAAGRLVAA
jgi:ABC-type multidrug transport system ATPase subunit